MSSKKMTLQNHYAKDFLILERYIKLQGFRTQTDLLKKIVSIAKLQRKKTKIKTYLVERNFSINHSFLRLK